VYLVEWISVELFSLYVILFLAGDVFDVLAKKQKDRLQGACSDEA
jgi:hypothetical protein